MTSDNTDLVQVEISDHDSQERCTGNNEAWEKIREGIEEIIPEPRGVFLASV